MDNIQNVYIEENITNDILMNNSGVDVLFEDSTLLTFKNVIVLLYVIVIVVALVGNGCVIYLVLSQRQMRNVTNYFIASLATSDALMALVCIPITFMANVLAESWPFPAWMCPFATYFQVVIVFQNAYTLMAISLERYIAIMYPFKRRLSMCQCYLVIAITWFMSFGTPLPTAIVSRLVDSQIEGTNISLSRCYEKWPTDEQRFSYSMTIMILQYFVPLAVLTYTYIRIVIVVWLKDTPPHGQMGASGRPMCSQRDNASSADIRYGNYVDPRKRIIKMMMTVVGIYGTCWLPIHLITIIGDINEDIWDNSAMRYVWLSAHWLAMSSCMYNPLIYWWMSEKFRWGYIYLLRCIRYRCCKCGDDMVVMNGREMPFQTSYSFAHDLPQPAPLAPVYRNGSKREECCGGSRRSGGGGANGLGTASGTRSEKSKGHKQNGVTTRCDLLRNKGETIPLRCASDPAESGLGSEDGEEADDHCFTRL